MRNLKIEIAFHCSSYCIVYIVDTAVAGETKGGECGGGNGATGRANGNALRIQIWKKNDDRICYLGVAQNNSQAANQKNGRKQKTRHFAFEIGC